MNDLLLSGLYDEIEQVVNAYSAFKCMSDSDLESMSDYVTEECELAMVEGHYTPSHDDVVELAKNWYMMNK